MSNATQNHFSSVELVYGQALLELAEQANQLDVIADQAKELVQLIAAEPGLARLLDSRMLTVEQRAAALDNVFKGNVDELLRHFMQVVNAKDRLNLLPSLLQGFLKLVDKRRGIVDVEAHVAARLDDAAAARVAEEIGKTLGQQVVLHQHVDPKLIGGIKLRIGDRVIDGSVAARLRQVRNRLIDAGREHARTGAAIETLGAAVNASV